MTYWKKEQIAVFQDVDNIPPWTTENGQLVLQQVVNYVQSNGLIHRYHIYLSNPRYEDRLEEIKEHLEPLDVWDFRFYETIVPYHRSNNGQRNAIDDHMIRDIFVYAEKFPKTTTYLLLTGDSDFHPSVIYLELKEKKVKVLSNSSVTSSLLERNKITS